MTPSPIKERTMAEYKLPFDKAFVLKLTLSNMRNSIDLSITRTAGRLKDFEADSDKWHEVLHTLSALDALKKLLDDFQLHNDQLLKEKPNG